MYNLYIMNNVVKQIEKLYSINVSEFLEIKEGNTNKNFSLISDDKKFFLKCYSNTDPERVKLIHHVACAFTEQDIPVLMPLENIHDNTVLIVEGTPYALFPMIDHDHLDRGDLTDSQIVTCAKSLASLHRAGEQVSHKYLRSFDGWDKQESLALIQDLSRELRENRENDPVDAVVFEYLKGIEKRIAYHDISYDPQRLSKPIVIHGDFHSENLLFKEDNVQAIIDFETVMYAPREYELLLSSIGTFAYGSINKNAIKNMRLYIQSYLKEYPIDQATYLYACDVYAHFFLHSTWSLERRYSDKDISAIENVLINIERQKFLDENLNVLKEMWIET